MAGPIEDTDRPPPTEKAGECWFASLEHELDPVQEAILEQGTRREIVALLAEVPGLNKEQAADRLGIDPRTLDDHLKLLASAGLVIVEDSDRDREQLCFIAKHQHLWQDEQTRILYGQSPTRWVAVLLVEREPCPTVEIAQALDRKSRTVRDHLTELRARGLAHTVRSSNTALHMATTPLREWVERWGGAYRQPGEGDD